MPPRRRRPAGPQLSQAEDDAQMQRLLGFLRDARGCLGPPAPTRGEGGSMLATGPLGRLGLPIAPPPGFNLLLKSYNRIVPAMKAVHSRAHRGRAGKHLSRREWPHQRAGGYSGQFKKDEIVLVGSAHLDSLARRDRGDGYKRGKLRDRDGGDVRLKTLSLPMARTIRMALWAGRKERGLRGSRAERARLPAVSRHLASATTSNLRTYNGGGPLFRGLQIQGRQVRVAPFRPMADAVPGVQQVRTCQSD